MFEFTPDQVDELGQLADFCRPNTDDGDETFQEFFRALEILIDEQLIDKPIKNPTPKQLIAAAKKLEKFCKNFNSPEGIFLSTRLRMPTPAAILAEAETLRRLAEWHLKYQGPMTMAIHGLGLKPPSAEKPPSDEFIVELQSLMRNFGFMGGRPAMVPFVIFCCRAAGVWVQSESAILDKVLEATAVK